MIALTKITANDEITQRLPLGMLRKSIKKKLTNNIKSNPKCFRKYIKSKSRYHKQVCTLTTELQEHVIDDEKAQALNDALLTVFVKESCPYSPCPEEIDVNIPMEEMTANEELILLMMCIRYCYNTAT